MLVKIITIDPTLKSWKSLPKKLKNITKTLQTMQNVGNVEVKVIEQLDFVPVVKDGRISFASIETLTKQHTKDGEAFIVLHMSNAQRTQLKIEPTLRGLAFGDNNFYSEAYFWADENTKRNRYNQFEETCLHEISHLIVNRTGGTDLTHEWHKKYGTIKGLFKYNDYRRYQTNLIDKVSSWLKNQFGPTKLQPLIERKAQLIVEEMYKLGYVVHVFEGYRSNERQQELYEQGRSKPGNIVTNAKAGESLHNYGVAVDIVFGPKGKPSWNPTEPWKKLGEVGKKYGFAWGGDWQGFTDLPHFEMTLNYKLSDFQNKNVDYSKFQ